ncbi:asparagine synthase-related protein [Humibacillus xanthopallidus]|uniref:asparagine synthase (glutamine-hydrolyzing) n=1 Tax=Humibacillus xanthopallidus TaxID=412689 RepID=A0A543I0F5_9MICO|nr:asparagine synthase-related protein [Humibacillus xanthopallidus]TQM64076.1 asparagine synthase (glutamine-hydrolysing) [Humibacillus xanthopallidus]
MCGISGHLGVTTDPGLIERLSRCDHDEASAPAVARVGSAVLAATARGDAAGRALVTSVSGRHTLVLDGELYEADVLREELTTLGHDITGGDASVALAAYGEWGAEGLDRLEGSFALAVHDRETDAVTLSRDPFGTRQLYVAQVPDAGGWLFSSTIRPILESGHHERRPNDRTIYRYLCFRVHDDGPETFFDGIERVGAGETLTLSAARAERHVWSSLRDELEAAPEPHPYGARVIEDFRHLLTAAVRRRTAGRVATSLSGGIDAAAIASVVDSLARADAPASHTVQQTWSVLFPDTRADEVRYVDDVVAALGDRVEAHRVEPTPTDFKLDLRDFVRLQEEPLVSTGAYTQFRVMREAAASEGPPTALLDGHGGDETLGGFGPHHLVHLRALTRSGGAAGAAKAAAELGRSLDVLARRGGPVVADRVRGRRDVPVRSLLGAQFAARFADESYAVERGSLHRRLVDDVVAGSLPARLRYADKNARHFGLRVRLPFLDRDLVRFVFALPDEALIHEGWSKRVLRDAMQGRVPESVRRRRDKVGATTPQGEWFMRLKNHIYGVFLSESFAERPYVDQSAVLHAFEGWIKGTNSIDSMTVWRMLNLELWLQEFFDEHDPAADEPERVKTDYEPNARKQLDLTLDSGTVVRRYPLRTDLYAREDDLEAKTLGYIERFFAGLPEAGADHAAATTGQWFFFISEKIVAITQGRSFFIWDIKVGRPARVLSRYVTRTPAGIGLGSPFTMQLAIEEAGLPRVLYASAGGFVGKLVGKRGLFYDLVGGDIRAIDGPTEYSVYPANVSAKLGPKDPDDVAARLSAAIRERVPEAYRETFGGTVVMDANDIGRNVLGKDAPGPKERYGAMFADNPLGQGSEQTPMAIVFEKPSV